jgi:hypothetical protein
MAKMLTHAEGQAMRGTVAAVLLGVLIGCGSGKGPAVPDTDDKPSGAAGGSETKPAGTPKGGSSSEKAGGSNADTTGGNTHDPSATPMVVGENNARAKPRPVAPGEAFTDPAQIFAGIPADAQAKTGDEGIIDRVAARHWLRERVSGRKLRWTVKVADVSFGDNTWDLTVYVSPVGRQTRYDGSDNYIRHMFGGPVTVGTSRWDVRIHRADYGSYVDFQYNGCTPNECRKMLALKGKTVTFEAVIKDFSVYSTATAQERSGWKGEWGEKYAAHHLDLTLSHPTLDGWLPASCVPKK